MNNNLIDLASDLEDEIVRLDCLKTLSGEISNYFDLDNAGLEAIARFNTMGKLTNLLFFNLIDHIKAIKAITNSLYELDKAQREEGGK